MCVCRFIGKMSRIEAEQCLHHMKDGVFLIRESDARQGEYAIALRYADSAEGLPCNDIGWWLQVETHAKAYKDLQASRH